MFSLTRIVIWIGLCILAAFLVADGKVWGLFVLGLVGFDAFRVWKNHREAGSATVVNLGVMTRTPPALTGERVAAAIEKAWGIRPALACLDDDNVHAPDAAAGNPDEPIDVQKFALVATSASSPNFMITLGTRLFLLRVGKEPFFAKDEASLPNELRIRNAILEHNGAFTIETSAQDEVQETERLVARLAAELIDGDAVALVHEATRSVYPIDEAALAALRSDDPMALFSSDDRPVPVIGAAADDPRLVAAVEEARRRWPEFVAAWNRKAGSNFSVKVPLTVDGHCEVIWVTVKELDEGSVRGVLGNDPVALGGLKIGDAVEAPVSDVEDWAFADSSDELRGAFSVRALTEIANGPAAKS